jgi:anti-sigma B factor antagonist
MQQRTHRRQDGQLVAIIAPVGKLDISTAWQFRLQLQNCISQLSPHVVLNLGQLETIDSAGMTTLVAGLRDAEKARGSFRLCNLPITLRPVFEISTMDNLFEIYDSEAAALAAE